MAAEVTAAALLVVLAAALALVVCVVDELDWEQAMASGAKAAASPSSHQRDKPNLNSCVRLT